MPKANILIVEDNRIVAKDIELRLLKMGYAVTASVGRGDAVLQEMDKKRPDLILMDIRLPGEMDGIETAQRLLLSYDIPVIYVTALEDDETLNRAMKTSPYGYIVKPVNSVELQSTIEIAVYKHQMERELKKSRARLSITLNSIGDGVISTDEKGIVDFINPPGEEMTGWQAKDAIGLPLSKIFNILNETTLKSVESPESAVLSSGLTHRVHHNRLLVHRDGSKMPISYTGSPICIKGEKNCGIVLVFQNKWPQRQAEQTLYESEIRFRELFKHMPVGVAVYETRDFGETFLFKDINRAGEHICYTRKRNLLHRDVKTAFPGIIKMGLLDLFKRVYLSGKPETLSTCQYEDDRINFWVENSVFKLPSGDIVGIFEDVTQRKELEEERDRILNLSSDLICIAGIDGYFKFLNPAWEHILGYPIHELIEKPVYEFIHSEDYEEKERAIKKLLSGESSVSFEIRHIHKDGTSRMIHWNAQCVMEKHVFYCIGRDVTQRREMETALHDKKKALDRLINNIPGAVYRSLVDRNWTILYLSEGIFEISGYRPDDFIQNKTLSYGDLIDERDREDVWNAVHKAIHKKEPFEITYRIKTIEKKEKWFWEKGEGVFNGGGELLYLEGIIVDISRQKRSEVLIKDAHERFKAVLDSIDAQIYVADIETYKVLFVNKKMQEDFSGSIMGSPCYKSFYNSSKPCEHCTNEKLFTSNGKPQEDGYLWEHMNPVTKRWYVNCDKAIKWSDDRMVRIQVATDITKFKAIEAELRQAQKIDALGVLAGGT